MIFYKDGRSILKYQLGYNRTLDLMVKETSQKYDAELLIPRMLYCTDNAAMIGAAAYPKYLKGEFSDYFLNVSSSADIV